jgi:hypothetical protein
MKIPHNAKKQTRIARHSVTPREAFEHATWKYANETYPQSCQSLLFDAGELGICLLEWSGSCGGRWRNVWYDRLHSLPNEKSPSVDAKEKANENHL